MRPQMSTSCLPAISPRSSPQIRSKPPLNQTMRASLSLNHTGTGMFSSRIAASRACSCKRDSSRDWRRTTTTEMMTASKVATRALASTRVRASR